MQTSKPYTFTIAGRAGPMVERFATLQDLAFFLTGWRAPVVAVTVFDWRG